MTPVAEPAPQRKLAPPEAADKSGVSELTEKMGKAEVVKMIKKREKEIVIYCTEEFAPVGNFDELET